MNSEPVSDLAQEFLGLARRFFQQETVTRRLSAFAGSYNSLESWLNWELFYCVATEMLGCVALRELGYPGPTRGNADLAICRGSEMVNDRGTLRVETKLIWDNALAGKVIAAAR